MESFRRQVQGHVTPQHLIPPPKPPRGVKKSSSFTEKSRRKRTLSKRTTHTVPSDKGERTRLERFRKECLSKALKWSTVDLLKHSKSFKADETNLHDILTHDELKQIHDMKYNKSMFRMFLFLLREKSFDKMNKWLSVCGFDDHVIQMVWTLYDDFSDKDTNQKRMKCFSCRLSSTFPASVVADHLFSAGVIDKHLYKEIFTSDLPIGIQMHLWNNIFQQCRAYPISIHVFSAFKIALIDSRKDENELEGDIDALLSDIETFTDNPAGLLHCYCNTLCKKALHPISCVKAMPISQVYFRKPIATKSRSPESNHPISSEDSPESDVSGKCHGVDTGEEGDCESLGSPTSPSNMVSTSRGLTKDIRTNINKKPVEYTGQYNPRYEIHEPSSTDSADCDVGASGRAVQTCRRCVPRTDQMMSRGTHVSGGTVSIGCTNIYVTNV